MSGADTMPELVACLGPDRCIYFSEPQTVCPMCSHLPDGGDVAAFVARLCKGH